MISTLAGRRVLVTRERPGELADLLVDRGAEVVHVPLIGIREPLDDGAGLAAQLARLDDYDWLAVTSAAGAERVGTAARSHPRLKLAAVGTTTARVFADRAGRPVDVVPHVQRAADLADALAASAGPRPVRVLIAQGDRAADELGVRLRAGGHTVTSCIAYRTVLLRPDPERLRGAHALALTSGSAAKSWVEAVGPNGPPVIVAIGPVTASVAERLGLKITSVSADHSLAGLVNELERQLSSTEL